MQIQQGLKDPFKAQAMPLLEYVLAGIKKDQARSQTPPKPRLPIMPAILARLREQWVTNSPFQDGLMLWAASSMGFFGFLKAGEFTVPSPGLYDKDVHLNLHDLQSIATLTPPCSKLRLSRARQTTFGKG